jgi:glycine cleavage system aminomethyltransferase T
MTPTLLATPLEAVLRAHGAVMAMRHGHLVAAHFGSVTSETAVCLRSVGLADGFGRGTDDDPEHVTLALIGPRAARVLDAAKLDAVPVRGGYEVVVPVRDGPDAWRHLLHAGEALGITCVGFDAVEHLAVSRRA